MAILPKLKQILTKNLKEKEPSKPKEDWSKAATKTSDLTDET